MPVILPDSEPVEPPAEIVRVEVTPGKVRAVAMPSGMTEGRSVQYEVSLEPVPGQPGLWREVTRKFQPLVKLTDSMEGLENTGLTRRDVLTLAYAGFIPAFRPGLQTTLVNPVAVWRHIQRTQIGPDGGRAAEFWQNRQNIRDYSEASQEVVSRGLCPRDAQKEAREADGGQGMLPLE
jgi:hypothetical protein